MKFTALSLFSLFFNLRLMLQFFFDLTIFTFPLLITWNKNQPTHSEFYEIFFILPASPLVSVLFLEENRHLITGSTDGQVSGVHTLWLFITRQTVSSSWAMSLSHRYGAFLYMMTSSVIRWPKLIWRSWKKDIKVIVSLCTTIQQIFSRTGVAKLCWLKCLSIHN